MGPENERLIRESWERLSPTMDRVASAFYQRLFEIDPDVRDRFATVQMDLQRQKFTHMMSECIRVLDDPQRLVGELAASGRRHVDYGATEGGYQSVGSALLWCLSRELGAEYTPAVKEAWHELYGLISGVMRRAGEKLQKTGR